MDRESPIPLWVVLSIGVVLVGGVYVVAQRSTVQPQASVIIKQTLVLSPSPTATPTIAPSMTPAETAVVTSTQVGTADWILCRNGVRGFQLKLPPGWREWAAGGSEARPATCDQEINTIMWAVDVNGVPPPPQLDLDISDPAPGPKAGSGDGDSTTVEDFLRNNPDWANNIMRETRTLDGERMVWFNDGSIVCVHKGTFYSFYAFEFDKEQDLLHKILATFEFTK